MDNKNLPQENDSLQKIKDRLAAYENTGLEPEEIEKLKTPTAEMLSATELERAFRIRDRQYMEEYAKRFLEWRGYSKDKITDDLVDRMIDLFNEYASMEECELNTWEAVLGTIQAVDQEGEQKEDNPVDFESPESQMELIYHAYQSLLRYDKNSFIFNSIKAGLVDVVNHFGADVFDGKLKLALEALDNEDVEEAIGFLGEILA